MQNAIGFVLGLLAAVCAAFVAIVVVVINLDHWPTMMVVMAALAALAWLTWPAGGAEARGPRSTKLHKRTILAGVLGTISTLAFACGLLVLMISNAIGDGSLSHDTPVIAGLLLTGAVFGWLSWRRLATSRPSAAEPR